MIDGHAATPPQLPLLVTEHPHPDLPGLALFGRFVGTWDMRVRFFDTSGRMIYDEPGTWSFAWVLDGRCVQDVLTYPHQGSDLPGERGIGTSLRHFDPDSEAWRVVWLSAVRGTLIILTARAAGDEIHLLGTDVDGSPLRWTFTGITDRSFHWTGLIADADGTWRMEQEMTGARRAATERGQP